MLRRNKFYVVVKKCVFMAPEVLLLGYVVLGDGLKVDESKTEAIRNWPRPRTITEVRSFQWLAAFYWHFTPHCNSIMALVTSHMKGTKFQWTKEAKDVF